MKKALLISLFLIIMLSFVGCSSKPDLNGNWIEENAEGESVVGLVVEDDDVKVYAYSDPEKTNQLLMWEGTITYPESNDTPYVFTATRDDDASMPAVTDKEIKFTYQDDVISFAYNSALATNKKSIEVTVAREN